MVVAGGVPGGAVVAGGIGHRSAVSGGAFGVVVDAHGDGCLCVGLFGAIVLYGCGTSVRKSLYVWSGLPVIVRQEPPGGHSIQVSGGSCVIAPGGGCVTMSARGVGSASGSLGSLLHVSMVPYGVMTVQCCVRAFTAGGCFVGDLRCWVVLLVWLGAVTRTAA